MKNKKKTHYSNKLFSVLILIATLFMGIGYASVNSVLLGIEGIAQANLQDGIYITEFNYDSSVNADYENSKIIYAHQTILNSSIILSENNPNSSITYQITIYNSKNNDYVFIGEDHLLSEDTYSNEDITFKLTGLTPGDVLESKESVTFTITFYYKDNILSENNILNSLLNFKFEYVTSPILTSNMIPVVYKNNEWAKTDNNSTDWYNYFDGKWANSITYNHNLVYNEVTNDTELKQFNGTSDYYILGRKNYDFGTNLTVMARFKIYEYGDATQIAIGNIETSGFYLGLNANNKIRFRHTDTSNADATTNQNLYSSQKIDLDTWYTVVVTYDGSLLKLYINGILEDSLEYTNVISKSAAPLAIGGNSSADGTVNSSYFKGAISEVAIMTESLSANEIAQNYGYIPNHIPTAHETLYYLKFDADNGVVANSAKYESDGMSFDGVDDFISVGYSSYDFNNSFSIGGRVKINAYSDEEYTIFGNPQNGGLNLFKSTDNKFEIAVFDTNTNGYINLETNFIPDLNTWYTLVATYDGTDLKLYVNGKEEASITKNINMLSVTTPFMIGVNPNLNSKLGDGYLNGAISDILLIDEGLTDEQISTYYKSDLKTIISEKTLIYYNLRSYESRDNNTVIPDEMINGMWVWIPRFSAITPTNKKIDITIVAPNEEAHDAFKFSNQDLDGFWIGKFENSSNVAYENPSLSINVNSNILIKANNNSLKNKNISYVFNKINNIITLSDIYGFKKSSYNILDTHLIKNNEWSAVAYFTQSKYGLCKNDNCLDLVENSSSLTGGNNYTSNIEQSTTQNIYGIYDISGGLNEFTMGNYNNLLNSLDGFSVLPNSMYLNVYTNENDYVIKKIQHAIFETNSIFNNSTSIFISEDKPWLTRNGLFSYNSSTGENNNEVGSRTILVIK